MRGAIAPRSLQFDADEGVGQELDAVERDRGAQDVSTEVLETIALVLVNGHLGVEVPA